MKKIIITKCGYSLGVYGCSNEYFNCIAIDGDKIKGFTFSGLYGSEHRVLEAFKKRGFEEVYVPLNTYGKLTRKDIGNSMSEHTFIEKLDELLANGKIN